MKIDIIYPVRDKKKWFFETLRFVIKILFIVGAIAVLIANYASGARPWCFIVIWSMLSIWKFIFSPDVIEYNRISFSVKILFYASILLIIIALVYSLDWLMFVLPVLAFSALELIATFFFINIRKQKHNMMPMIWLIIVSFIAIATAFFGLSDMNWPMIVLGSTALVVLIAVIVILRVDLFLELRKRFHTK